MSLRKCWVQTCSNAAERAIGSCMICARHWCANHVSAGVHTCPSEDGDPEAFVAAYQHAKREHLRTLISKIDADALQSAASKARQGVSCQIPVLREKLNSDKCLDLALSQCGGQNCNLDIEFTDGITWIARIRLTDPLLPPTEVQKHIFLSELATLEFLSNTRVPTPRIYGYANDSPENDVGVPYMLMEKLPGTPLNWQDANLQQRNRVMEQLADVYLELEKHPIPLTGSLVQPADPGHASSETQVGGFAQEPCYPTPVRSLGPFPTLDAAYTALINQQMQTIANSEVSGLPIDNYLAFLYRLAVLPELVVDSASRRGPFYLRHYDDKGDHILVDDEHNITGIIDWEFASAEAKELAFSAPCMMWPVRTFYDGQNALSDDELRFAYVFQRRGREDLAAIVRGARRWQRYLFFLGGGMPRTKAQFQPLFQGLRQSFTRDGEAAPLSSYDEWKESALRGLAKGNTQIDALMQAEKQAAEVGNVVPA